MARIRRTVLLSALALAPLLASAAESAGAAQGAPGKAAAAAAAPAAPIEAGKPVATPTRIRLQHYLVVSALVFALGVMVITVRRNAIAVLMGIELLLNAVGLNFVAFSKFVARDLIDGQVVTIFIIVIAAAEAAVALAIILNIYNNLNTVTVDEADTLRG